MINEKQILEKVSNIIDDKLGFPIEEISLESNIINDLGADSLDKVELIVECEKEFDISIPDDQSENVSTVGDMVNLIKSILETN